MISHTPGLAHRLTVARCRALAVLGAAAVAFGGLVFVSVLVFGVAPASAAMVHQFVRTFNGAGEAPEALQIPNGLAVDDSPAATNGDVYVGDTVENVVDRFDSTGKYLGRLTGAKTLATGAKTLAGSFASPAGLAVDQSNGDMYVVDRGHGVVDKFKASAGEELPEKSFGAEGEVSAASISPGQLGSPGTGESFIPAGVAVDPRTGDLYVSDMDNSVIDVFDSAGTYQRQFPYVNDLVSGMLAVDSSGDLFVADGVNVLVFVAANGMLNRAYGEGSAALDSGESYGVTVDPANDDVYVSDRKGLHVAQYSKTGALILSWGPEHLSALAGAADSGIGVGDGPGGGIYVANDASGDVAVFTRPLVLLPDVSTTPATGVTARTASVHGTVGADGGPSATCAFQYVSDAAFQAGGFEGAPSVACFPAGPFLGSGEEAVSADLAALSPETTYYYRLVGANENGSYPAAAATFKTLPAVAVQTEEATGLAAGSATLNGVVAPEGQSIAECFFEYGESEAYGQSKPCEEPAAAGIAGSGPVKVHAAITGLTVGSTYHFRLVASNASGMSHAADQILGVPPKVDGASVADVTTGSAELQAEIEPGGVTASYHFEYLSEEQYEQDGRSFSSGPVPPTKAPAPDAMIASTRSAEGVFQSLSGLDPESTYYYRVVVANSTVPGGVGGPVERFTTHATAVEAGLPDQRVYELVSPALKTPGAGGSVGFAVEAAEDGSNVVYSGEDAFGQTKEPFDVLYASVRGPNGWSTQNVSGETRAEAFAPLPRPYVPSVPALPESLAAPQARVLEGTPDGSEIFFLDEEQLTSDSTAAPGEPDLYRYDTTSKQLTDLTVDVNTGGHADVQGILGTGGPAGEDGSYVYLVATGDLTGAQANGQGAIAQAGEPNLYLSHGGVIIFIATLSAGDSGNWESAPGSRTSEVSSSGRYVAFVAGEGLTGQAAGSSEVFRYDAGSGSLLCASCERDGSTSPAAFLPLSGGGMPRMHYMADDDRVFFDDAGPLSPQDVNGHVDVYEFEDAGTGTCRTRGGCLSLISGGGGSSDSLLAAVSAEGNDVFFTTSQQLVPEDRDGVEDLYDARVDGRRPEQSAPGCETGEACHEPASQPLIGQIAGSTVFSGPGNVTQQTPQTSVGPSRKRAKAMTRVQKLAKALKLCRRDPGRRRASCERSARRRYGSKTSAKRSTGRSK